MAKYMRVFKNSALEASSVLRHSCELKDVLVRFQEGKGILLSNLQKKRGKTFVDRD